MVKDLHSHGRSVLSRISDDWQENQADELFGDILGHCINGRNHELRAEGNEDLYNVSIDTRLD